MLTESPDHTGLFRALADPTRRAVFERLMGREMTVSDLTTGFSVSQPAISQHLAALCRAGLLVRRRAGIHAYYRLVDPQMSRWCQALSAAPPAPCVARLPERLVLGCTGCPS